MCQMQVLQKYLVFHGSLKHQARAGDAAQWYSNSTCLACARPQV